MKTTLIPSLNSHLGSHVFGASQIASYLPTEIANHWLAVMEGTETFRSEYLPACAEALQKWALSLGATHSTHWFQPLRTTIGEKHDSFLEWDENSQVLESLSASALLQREADASSFPSGNLRCTHQARGYTIWDPTTPPFLYKSAKGSLLCIPALFFSLQEDSLDYKTPLLRSEQQLNLAVQRALSWVKEPLVRAHATLGVEQEFFLLSQEKAEARADLLLAKRTLYGASPCLGQELEQHYLGKMDTLAHHFLREIEQEAQALGIPIKAFHKEVAPHQYEMTPLFEKSSLAADHNALLMTLMEERASQYGLTCLFHEKPFAKLNGSGKHCNWSLATEEGKNLLVPDRKNPLFLILLTAFLKAIHEHGDLLRSTTAYAGNDWRLGGAEAPPTILAVYLGNTLQQIVDEMLGIPPSNTLENLRTALPHFVPAKPILSDRNRTAFVAFTDCKFEVRGVGASQNISWPIAILNTMVAESLNELLDHLETQEFDLSDLTKQLRPHLQQAAPIIFSDNHYSAEWAQEAEKRQLPNIRNTLEGNEVLGAPRTTELLKHTLSVRELQSRQEIFLEQYIKQLQIEYRLAIQLFRTRILPAALRYQQLWSHSLEKISSPIQQEALHKVVTAINRSIRAIDELEQLLQETDPLHGREKARLLCDSGLPALAQARKWVDQLEEQVDMSLWPFPKYQELLFL